jgi:hypothetical protein
MNREGEIKINKSSSKGWNYSQEWSNLTLSYAEFVEIKVNDFFCCYVAIGNRNCCCCKDTQAYNQCDLLIYSRKRFVHKIERQKRSKSKDDVCALVVPLI